MKRILGLLLLGSLLVSCGKSPSITGVSEVEPKNTTTWVHTWDSEDESLDESLIDLPTIESLYLSYYPNIDKITIHIDGDVVYMTEKEPLVIWDGTTYYRFMYTAPSKLDISQTLRDIN